MAISMLPPQLTLEEKALRKKLDDRLSIKDIATLRYRGNQKLIDDYAFEIAEACLKPMGIDYFHEVRHFDWRWLCEHPEHKLQLLCPLVGCDDIKHFSFNPERELDELQLLLPLVGRDELKHLVSESDLCSPFALESEWEGDTHPMPAFKYNDTLSRYKRFYCNNRGENGRDSDAFTKYRWAYANDGRCKVSAKEFKKWLVSKHGWPLPPDCLLNNWFGAEAIPKADLMRVSYYGAGTLVYTEYWIGSPEGIRTEMRQGVRNAIYTLSLSDEKMLRDAGRVKTARIFPEHGGGQLSEKTFVHFELDEPHTFTVADIVQENNGSITEAVRNGVAITQTVSDTGKTKKPKYLIPKKRDTNELLILIYNMFESYGLKDGDERGKHSAKTAWGELVASKFKDGLIRNIEGERKSAIITLNGGTEVDFDTFLRTYNRRFKA
ncbi:hypothetical protein [Methylovulum psychrotolerans]|uniref:Uncharacterized protein n=1 Tax=Methylovulum psychrotolerans TaxID=1704499 RepID=A0A2S5CK21_9GAMM|nr:hypothetical protein [Methylovulum psychrotolerans]POZ51169.1 hypothetical protein AADEFJLK_03128 [Methylovulum psychrotolerans]